MRVWHKIGVTLEMIKWEHSTFALPFALTAAMLAASGWPRINQLLDHCLHGARAICGDGIQPFSMQGTLGPERGRFRRVS
jgi:hypothetical protein